jgi:peptidoglycan/LPS O-acetylase OafA/YrhL
MSAGALGDMIGSFLLMLVISMVVVMLLRLIPPLKRKPAIAYGVGGLLAVFLGFASVSGGGDNLPYLPSLLAVVLTWIVLVLDYRRVSKKARAAPQVA